MTALPARRRRKNLLMVGVNVVALSLVAVLAVVGVLAIRDYTAARNAASDIPVDELPSTPTALFATVDTDDQLTSVSIFVLSPGERRGGSIVSIPVNADDAGGSVTERRTLRQAYAEGGLDGLMAGVESALRLTIGFSDVADPFAVGQILQPLGTIDVKLVTDVRTTVDGRSRVLYTAGERTLSAPQVAELLAGRDEEESDQVRRPNIEAAWSGVAAAVGEGVAGLVPPEQVTSFDDVIARLFAGPVGSRGLPAAAYPEDENPEALDVVKIDAVEATFVFASIAPASMSAPAPGPVYRVEAMPGYEDKVRAALSILLYFGGNVTSVSLSTTVGQETLFYAYDARVLDKAGTLNPFFGAILFPEPERRVAGIDITIVLGLEFLQSPSPPAPLPSTTLTSDPPADPTADTTANPTETTP